MNVLNKMVSVMPSDDGMAILSAFNSPELDIIGLTTIFGNVRTETATVNAFKLLDLASQAQVIGWHAEPLRLCQVLGALQIASACCILPLMLQVPVAEGSHVTFIGLPKTWVADFVHGSDGFGNMAYPPIQVIADFWNFDSFSLP